MRRGLRHLQRCPPLGVADAGLRSVGAGARANTPPSQQLLQQQHAQHQQHAADLPILEQHLQEQLQQLGAHQVQTAHQAPLHFTQQQLPPQEHQAPVQHTLDGNAISGTISNATAAPATAKAAATQPTVTTTVTTSTTSTSSTSTSTSASTSNQAEAHAQRLFDFNTSHIPAWSPLLALYFPIGVVLAALRMLLWIGGVLIDAPWFRSQLVVRTYLALLGFKATWRNTALLPKGRHVMVSNHVTPGDLMVLFEVGLQVGWELGTLRNFTSQEQACPHTFPILPRLLVIPQRLPQRYMHLITTAMPTFNTSTIALHCSPAIPHPLPCRACLSATRTSSQRPCRPAW